MLVEREDEILFVGTPSYTFIVMGLTTELGRRFGPGIDMDMQRSLLPRNFQIIPYDLLYDMFRANVPPRFFLAVPDLRADTSLQRKEANQEKEKEDIFADGYWGPSHDDLDPK
jgi:hypothetical protein